MDRVRVRFMVRVRVRVRVEVTYCAIAKIDSSMFMVYYQTGFVAPSP
jgi:hypothetical protein